MINKLKNLPPESGRLLKTFSELARHEGVKIYLVGGAVRDVILGRKTFDLDIVVEGDAIKFAHKFAEKNKKKFKKHEKDGLLATPGDEKDLAGQIRKLLNNPQQRRDLGVSGRQKVIALYNQHTNNQNMVTLFHEEELAL